MSQSTFTIKPSPEYNIPRPGVEAFKREFPGQTHETFRKLVTITPDGQFADISLSPLSCVMYFYYYYSK